MRVIKDDEIAGYEGRIESNKLVTPSHLTSKVLAKFRGDEDTIGDPFPWQKLTDKFRMRPGEVTIWGGWSGSGKSAITSHFLAWLLPKRRICIASMEMPLDSLMVRMYRQLSGNNQPAPEYIEQIAKRIDNSLYLYNTLETVTPDRIVALVRYCARELKLDHMVVDSLVKCGTGTGNDANQRQADLMDAFQWAVKETQMHLHVVHHLRKGVSEDDVPGKHDLKGAGELADLTDNLVICWRNKAAEQDETKKDDFNMVLNVCKQRHGEGWEGKVGLYFHPQSLQYTTQKGRRMEWT